MSSSAGNASVHGDHGLAVRLVYLAVAAGWSVLRIAAAFVRGQTGQTVVLCYHGVSARQRDGFAWQMSKLAGRAIDIALPTVPSLHRDHLPQVCVTFDDAYANLLDSALPVTRRLRIPVIIFAVAGNLGRKPDWPMPPGHPDTHEATMTPAQLTQAIRQGLCRVGSHTLTHKALGQCPSTVVEAECFESRHRLREVLGQPVEDLALPYGSCNDEVLAAALAAGYRRIYTLQPRVHRPGYNGVIGRFCMTPETWRIEFLLTCAGGYSWLYPWRRLLRRIRSVVRPAERREPSLA